MKKILVVDDEEMNLFSTKYILEKAGYQVVTAESGERGIKILKEQEFDLLLLDIEMPGMDGLETLKSIRQIPMLADLKVMFLTASTSKEDIERAVRLGAKNFIKKPCMPEEITRVVEKALDAKEQPLMLAVDDQSVNLMMIKMTFEDQYRVEGVASGEEALNFMEKTVPDIVILDLNMPGIDGRETFARMKKMEGLAAVPVVFLTADDDDETELELFQAGAMELIRKPFIAEIMKERIRRIMELKHLQGFLQEEVTRKTRALTKTYHKLQRLSVQIIDALSGAIDAKDTYTNGHSNRVAEYARELAVRMGKNEEEVNDIYFAAMLHDVGKIGVPNEIINKPGRLTDAEFEIIKEHTVKGAEILDRISELPKLSVGAHWHHERYDGKGYPDGLAGEEIPETARLICVADCYDAMTSNRSYRDALSQKVVREEIRKGKGTQFDPEIAEHMLHMIDEDVDFLMRERY